MSAAEISIYFMISIGAKPPPWNTNCLPPPFLLVMSKVMVSWPQLLAMSANDNFCCHHQVYLLASLLPPFMPPHFLCLSSAKSEEGQGSTYSREKCLRAEVWQLNKENPVEQGNAKIPTWSQFAKWVRLSDHKEFMSPKLPNTDNRSTDGLVEGTKLSGKANFWRISR